MRKLLEEIDNEPILDEVEKFGIIERQSKIMDYKGNKYYIVYKGGKCVRFDKLENISSEEIIKI